MQLIAEKLRSKNLKVTSQRMSIYNMLASTKSHPSAEAIYKELREDNPAMSFATVYKTLATFKEHNLIRELSVLQDSFRYDAETESHPHFICLGCGEVFDMETDLDISQLQERLSEENAFQVSFAQLNFFGYCEKCKK